MHALDWECAQVSARGCDVITKGVQQVLPDQLRHHLRPRAPVRARNDPDPPGRVPACPGTLQTPRRVIPYALLVCVPGVAVAVGSDRQQ